MKTHSLSEVAEALGVSTRTVEIWISTGELRAVNVSRNRHSRKPRHRVTDADLNAFLASRETGKPARQTGKIRRKTESIPRYV